jgi:hypothetical protein
MNQAMAVQTKMKLRAMMRLTMVSWMLVAILCIVKHFSIGSLRTAKTAKTAETAKTVDTAWIMVGSAGSNLGEPRQD